jgi:signal transduction histidine kinase
MMNIGVLLLDPAGNIEFASPLACELLGFQDEKALRADWPTMKSLLHLDVALPSTTRPRSLTADISVHDRIRFLRLEVDALNAESSPGYSILLRDRQRIDALETDLVLASQMRAQVHLYGALTHDLRAPLNAMQITAELLADTLDADSPAIAADREARQLRYVEVLREELARLNRALQTVLDHGAPLDAAAEKLDLADVVRDTVTLLGPQAGRQRVELQVFLPDSAAMIAGHRDRLRQALLNIAISSLEAMPGGGGLKIVLAVQDQEVSIALADSGPGISEALLDEIFRVCVPNKKDGSGIGLYVARLVVDSHRGDMKVENEPAGGTCFTLSFPRV